MDAGTRGGRPCEGPCSFLPPSTNPFVAGKGKVDACITANEGRAANGGEPTWILGLDWVTDSVEKGVKQPEDQYDSSVEGADEEMKVEEKAEEKVEKKVAKGKGKRAREPSEDAVASPVAAGTFAPSQSMRANYFDLQSRYLLLLSPRSSKSRRRESVPLTTGSPMPVRPASLLARSLLKNGAGSTHVHADASGIFYGCMLNQTQVRPPNPADSCGTDLAHASPDRQEREQGP